MPGIEEAVGVILENILSCSATLNLICEQLPMVCGSLENCFTGWTRFFVTALGISDAIRVCSLAPSGTCGMLLDICTMPYGFPLGWCYDLMIIPMDLYASGDYGGCMGACDIVPMFFGFCADTCDIPWGIFETVLDAASNMGAIFDTVIGVPICGVITALVWFVGCFGCGGFGSFSFGILSMCCEMPRMTLDACIYTYSFCPLIFDQCHIMCDLPPKVFKQIFGHDISYMVCQVFTDMITACSESPYICLTGIGLISPFQFLGP